MESSSVWSKHCKWTYREGFCVCLVSTVLVWTARHLDLHIFYVDPNVGENSVSTVVRALGLYTCWAHTACWHHWMQAAGRGLKTLLRLQETWVQIHVHPTASVLLPFPIPWKVGWRKCSIQCAGTELCCCRAAVECNPGGNLVILAFRWCNRDSHLKDSLYLTWKETLNQLRNNSYKLAV